MKRVFAVVLFVFASVFAFPHLVGAQESSKALKEGTVAKLQAAKTGDKKLDCMSSANVAQ